MTSTTPAALHAAAERFDGHAIVDGEVVIGWPELLASAQTVARALIALGVDVGDRVAIVSPNTHHWVSAVLGIHYAGATAVPVNTRFTGPEMADVITRSRARAVFVAGDFLGVDRIALLRAEPGLDDVRIIRVPIGEGPAWADLDTLADGVPLETAVARARAVNPDDVSDILFTSGTTGRSKGAMSAHRQSLGVAAVWAERGGLTSADRYLIVNPFFHSFGYKAGILAALLTGATIVPQAVFDLDRTLDLVADHRITVLPGPPTIYQTMLDRPDGRDLSSLRLAVTGAAPVPVVLVERMRAELGFTTVLTAYGLTEAVVVTMCVPEDSPDTISRTSGRPADCEVRVADDTGEILVRGPNVMLGYLDDPAATAEAISPDGWLRTGDVGVLDDGYLTITDRLKDMYVTGGFNVYPAEVEQVLARLPGIAESAVVGVPDARLGEVGRAYVIPSPGATLSADEVLAHCGRSLANYKIPREVEFRGELPRNATGKILKRILRHD